MKIESGIPIPPKRTGGWHRTEGYPWERMTDGDSFAVYCPNRESYRRMAARIYANAKAHDVKVAMRWVGSKLRVWRTGARSAA